MSANASEVAAASAASTAAAARPERLAARLARGAFVEVAGFGASQILRLGANIVLTRILFPQAFGLMAMLQLVLVGLTMLTDVGIVQAVVRSPRGEDPLFLDTAWSIKVGRGLGLWLAAAVLAWPAAALFREPTLRVLVPVGSASIFVQALGSMRVLVLRRHVRLVPLAALDLSAQVIGIAVMIVLARGGAGVWALAAGTIAGAAANTGLSFFLPGTHRDHLRIDREARHEILHFGRWIFASSAVTFAAARGDQIVFGRLLGAASLGVYNIALALAELPSMAFGRVVDGVLYPSYARVHNERAADFPRVYYRSRLVLDTLGHGALGGLFALAPWLIQLLYDQRYRDAAPMLQILAIRTSLTLLANPCQTALFVCGESRYAFRRNLAVALCTLAAMPVGHYLAGPLGLLWGSTVARAAALPMLWPAARKAGFLKLDREALFIPAFGAGWGLGRALLLVLPHR